MRINVLVAEQEPMMRECMVRLVEAEDGLRVVGQACDGREAVALAEQLSPGAAVVDIDLPIINGIEAVRRMHEHAVPAVVVCTTPRQDPALACTALQAGAAACLDRYCSPADFVAAIRAAAQGGGRPSQRSLSPRLRTHLLHSAPGGGGAFVKLTPREREVLQLLAEGYMAKEIAHLLDMSAKTVSTHRVHIKDKLGIRNVALLTKYAIREGLTRL